ncbi:MAG: putative b-lactamase [Parcubacteria bacterium C7867-004]|nr:MAG: putative b-lactamase [Parcubacteria bacterium C7867-004]
MKVTKYGHSCLLIEEGNARIITDPGIWNPTPGAVDVDAVLITHEHQDHLDMDQLKEILSRNTGAVVITHESVGKLLTEAGIEYTTIEPGSPIDVNGVSVESFGTEHAIVYGDSSPCRNTGFLIGEKLFVPGDALHDIPSKSVEVLALPTGGPWMRMNEAIDYAKKVAPKIVFPIHDAMYIEDYQRWLVPRVVGGNLESAGIELRDMPDGSTEEF